MAPSMAIVNIPKKNDKKWKAQSGCSLVESGVGTVHSHGLHVVGVVDLGVIVFVLGFDADVEGIFGVDCGVKVPVSVCVVAAEELSNVGLVIFSVAMVKALEPSVERAVVGISLLYGIVVLLSFCLKMSVFAGSVEVILVLGFCVVVVIEAMDPG